MIDYKNERESIVEFLTNKDKHLFHPIFSHDLAHFPRNNSRESVWKISIQGRSVYDSIELLERLAEFLKDEEIHYKVATATRFDIINLTPNGQLTELRIKEQSQKAMTIYCPIDVNILDLCKEVQERLNGYSPEGEIFHPSSYELYGGYLYYRKDTDENGEYIMPN